MPKRLSKEEIAEIIMLYQDGVTPKDIGEKFNIRNNSVTRILRKRGVPRTQGSQSKQTEVISETPLDQEKVYKLHQKGLSYEEIAKELKSYPHKIKAIVQDEKEQCRINEIINEAKKVHDDNYDYSKTKRIDKSKISIICREHGEFIQNYHSHLGGHGCAKCGKKEASQKQRKTQEQTIADFKKIHQDKFDYSSVKYTTAFEKVEIICSQHGSFWQAPHDHLKGQGCPSCRSNKISKTRAKPLEDFIKEAQEVHSKKYSYTKSDYKNSKFPLTITCPEHGDFNQSPNAHLRGQGCPNCWIDRFKNNNPSKKPEVIEKIHQSKKINKSYGKSKVEDLLNEFLCNKFDKDDIQRQCNINNSAIDFYIKSKNLYIQVDGVYYHGLDRELEEIQKFNTETDKVIYKTALRDQEQSQWFIDQDIDFIRVTDKEINDYFDNNKAPSPYVNSTSSSLQKWNEIFNNEERKINRSEI